MAGEKATSAIDARMKPMKRKFMGDLLVLSGAAHIKFASKAA
jgi:hypothetical protein